MTSHDPGLTGARDGALQVGARAMRLHVLCGARSLLRPDMIGRPTIEGLVGDRARSATAFWLSRRCGRFYHDFLLDDSGDRRIEVFGAALARDFGARFVPLLALPELIESVTGEEAASRAEAGAPRIDPLAAVAGICEILQPGELVLHALALPPQVDPDGLWAGDTLAAAVETGLAAVRAACAEAGVCAGRIKTALREVEPECEGFEPLYRNAVASTAARRFCARRKASGLVIDEDRAAATVRDMLGQWRRTGISPDWNLDMPRFAALNARLMRRMGAVFRA